MTENAPSALIVTRDPTLAYLCQSVLTGLGWRTEIRLNGPLSNPAPPGIAHDLCLIDLDDPRAGGASRMATRRIGMTSNQNPQHRWQLIESGFADYLLKPFPPPDLARRVTLAMRQTPPPQPKKIGTQRFDPACCTLVKGDGTTRTLTPAETALLGRLVNANGRTLTAALLAQGITANITSLRTLIRRLRCHIETDPSHPTHLLTQPNGYCLRTETAVASQPQR